MAIQVIKIQRDPPSNIFDTLTAETINANTINGDLTGNVDGGTVEGTIGQFGNVAGGNYSDFEADGTLKFNGDATVWEDIRVPLERAKTAGANVPVYTKFKDDGAASAGVYAYDFDDGDEIFLSVQMSHSWREGSIIYPHIHLVSVTDGTGKKTKLTMEYTWANRDTETFGNTTIINRDVDLSTAYKHLHFNFSEAGIDATGKTISSILICRIARNAADSDNFTGDIFFLEFDVHFEVDTVGSRQILEK